MLDIRQLSKSFGSGAAAVPALRGVDVTIAEGEFFTLLGPSGCGKTTLLRMIAGFEAPTAGQIVLDGADISAMPPNLRPVNTVFQSYALFPHMTVAQNVAFGLEALGRPRAEVAETVDRMLHLVQMPHLRDRRSAELSGGQQQRVALARALAPKPRILLLDEPLSALDMKLRKEMQIELKRLQRETGLTFIFVTHDQEEALTMSDRIAVMSGGEVQQIASPRDLYENPANHFVAGFIGESNVLRAGLAGGAVDLGGQRLALPGTAHLPAGDVDIMIRPEHVTFGPAGPDAFGLTARVTGLIYFGTDTHVELALPGGERMVARIQNARGDALPRQDEDVAIALPLSALRLLTGGQPSDARA